MSVKLLNDATPNDDTKEISNKTRPKNHFQRLPERFRKSPQSGPRWEFGEASDRPACESVQPRTPHWTDTGNCSIHTSSRTVSRDITRRLDHSVIAADRVLWFFILTSVFESCVVLLSPVRLEEQYGEGFYIGYGMYLVFFSGSLLDRLLIFRYCCAFGWIRTLEDFRNAKMILTGDFKAVEHLLILCLLDAT